MLQQSADLAITILKVPSFEVTPTQVMAFKKLPAGAMLAADRV
jgi:hypothetical protein